MSRMGRITEERPRLQSMSSILSGRQFRVVQMLFVDGLTQAEVGAQIGLSQRHVGRILEEAMDQLRISRGFIIDFDEPT